MKTILLTDFGLPWRIIFDSLVSWVEFDIDSPETEIRMTLNLTPTQVYIAQLDMGSGILFPVDNVRKTDKSQTVIDRQQKLSLHR